MQQIVRFVNVVTVKFKEDISILNSAQLWWPILIDEGNEYATRRVDIQYFSERIVDRRSAQADPAVRKGGYDMSVAMAVAMSVARCRLLASRATAAL